MIVQIANKYMAYRRQADGVLVNIQSGLVLPSAEEQTARTAALGTQHGGVWSFVELTPDQFQQALIILHQQRGATLTAGGEVIGRSLMTLSSNKSTIAANGIDSATITLNTQDATYTGAVHFEVVPPEGEQAEVSETCTAGIATLTLTTLQAGVHELRASALGYGLVNLTIEGIV